MKLLDFKFCLLFLLFASLTYSQAGFNNYITSWSKNSVFTHAQVGVAVYDVTTNYYLGGLNPRMSLIPASSLKVITTYAANEVLGSDFRFSTQIAHDGTISNGTLNGNLYIIGSGDPSLGSDRFEGYPDYKGLMAKIAKKIKDKDIKNINGQIIVDESIFKSYPIAPTWQWNDLGNYYAAGAWGLNISENKYSIFFNTNKSIKSRAQLLYTDPPIEGLNLTSEVTIDSANTGDNAYIFGGPYVYQKRIVGTLPKSERPFKIEGSIPDPPKYFASGLQEYLFSQGLGSTGSKVIYENRPPTKNLDTINSPNLKELIRQTNHRSLNTYCDALLKKIGLEKKRVGSSEEGISYLEDFILAKGINIDALNLQDGSGLSARSYTSSEILARVLAHYANRNGIQFMQYTLPQAGNEGSVRSLLFGKSIAKNFYVKSGSMDRVLSYTGLCRAKSGKWVSFCIIVNHYNIKSRLMRERIEPLLESIYNNF
jgi:serine-type D-Ala-D-Ala carboxypeptidase/endopeptidase (penicillin-binding protein 4)